MTAFKWKKKAKLGTSSATEFSQQPESEEEDCDWLCPAKRVCVSSLEDSQIKSKRLQSEGALLAENGRYWEAVKYWDEAIQLTPDVATIHEMKAQALLEVGEVFPAVVECNKAVLLDSHWAIARQTLGRAQLGLGELIMARDSFQKAIHLLPSDQEIRADLKWTLELIETKRNKASGS